jgi:hypothetical protein
MHKDLMEHPRKYGQFHSYFITTPFNYGKCKNYWKVNEEGGE